MLFMACKVWPARLAGKVLPAKVAVYFQSGHFTLKIVLHPLQPCLLSNFGRHHRPRTRSIARFRVHFPLSKAEPLGRGCFINLAPMHKRV